MTRYEVAVGKFNAANAQDSNSLIDALGSPVPKELHHARLMTAWVKRLVAEPSEPLLLAARCQHICRWEVPRKSFPEGRAGYLKWRQSMKHFHAKKAADIMDECGYNDVEIARVNELNLKENLKGDPECQTLEDALCLTFLEVQFAEFAPTQSEEKMVSILQKSWKKMSPSAHEWALKLPMSDAARALVEKALAG